MSNLAYFHPQDNVAASGAATIGAGTEDTAYPRANLYDLNPAKPMKFTTTSGAIVWDWTNPQQIDAVLLPMHNLQAGLEVRWQMHTSNVWTAPDVNQLISIPAWDADGFPPSVWLDLASLVPTAANRTKRFGRFVVVGTNSAPVALGEILLYSTKRELAPRNITYPVKVRETRPRKLHETDYGVRTKYDLGAKVRVVAAQIRTTMVGRDQIRTWMRACKNGTLATAIVPDQSENLALMVEWDTDTIEHAEEFLDVAELPLVWRELSRGLPL